ncbi:MAG: hypothetical protein M1833_006052 [Piccolia ochrophora]|nr:MAG: hypothetical protein M1833_006052 [Piccolia ochrophora]
MDLAKALVRSVARAFYETRHILVVDALMVHSALRDDDLAHLLGMQTKELRKLCAKLEEHRLLSVHNRQETREGMQRPISRTYYFVNFRQTIDAIKYRIYRVTKEVEGMIRPTEEKKDYFCPRCKSRWTQMEVLDNPGPFGFDCHKCGAPLEHDDEVAGDRGGHEKQSKLMSQLDPLLNLLRQIDEVLIPDSTFESAFNAAIPVARNRTTNPIAATVPVYPDGTGPPTAVRGMAQNTIPKLEIDLTSSAEKSAAEQAAEARERARIAAQNALPDWHTHSTVSGEATALGTKEAVARQERDAAILEAKDENGKEESKKLNGAEMSDELADYYAQLARDQELAAQKKLQQEDEEDEEEEEDDDDGEFGSEADEFEDVPAPSATNAPPPAGGANGSSATNGAALMARTKSVESEFGSFSGSSAAATGTNSGTPVDGPSPAKRVRIAEPTLAAVDAKMKQEENGDDDDEDIEFEDV